MISSLNGTLIARTDSLITINLIGGIALDVASPYAAEYMLNAPISLVTYFHWHQEQGPSLYGFNTQADRTLFILLISTPGIGPKMALALMAQLSTAELADTLSRQDVKALSALNGIGAKKAEILISHTHSKILKLIESGALAITSGQTQHLNTISQTLTSLNYSRAEITQALTFVQSQTEHETATFDLLLRKALSFLSQKR